jgi:DNA repair protein RadC
MHNHPSGDLTPSNSDDNTTRSIASVGEIMGIRLLDHLIVSENDYYSYVEKDRLRYE